MYVPDHSLDVATLISCRCLHIVTCTAGWHFVVNNDGKKHTTGLAAVLQVQLTYRRLASLNHQVLKADRKAVAAAN